MNTYFANPERKSSGDLQSEIKIEAENPVITGLLHSISGLLAAA